MRLAGSPAPHNAVRWLLITVLATVGVGAVVPARAVASCPTNNRITHHTCVTAVALSRTTADVRGRATVPPTAAAMTVLLAAGGVTAHAVTTCPTINGVTAPTCVTSVSVSRTTAAVTGAGSVPLVVSVGFHSDPGVPSGGVATPLSGELPDVAPELRFNVRRGGGSYSDDRVSLALASGDVHDGVWQGTRNLTALDRDTLTTSFVNVGGPGQARLSRVLIPVDLRRTVRVAASHIPKFDTDFLHPGEVAAGAPFTVVGRVIDMGTLAGLPRITVWVQERDASCGCFLGRYPTTTDAAGNWRVRVPHLTQFEYEASVEGPANSDGRRANVASALARPYVLGSVSASLSAKTAHVGDTVLVTGTAQPAGGQNLYLEKWVSRAWRVVATARPRTSGRFTLPVTTSAPGHWEYQVRDDQAHATSAPMFLDVS